MKIENKREKNIYLGLNLKGMGSYALVTYDNHTDVIWITKYRVQGGGTLWFLEAPCQLRKFDLDLSDPEVKKYITEAGLIVRNGAVYDIDSLQTAPFLPDKLDDLTLISEEYCFEWMLNHKQ